MLHTFTSPHPLFIFAPNRSSVSFCALTALVGVEVFGAPLSTEISIVIVAVVVVLSGVALAVSYFCYRSKVQAERLAAFSNAKKDQ